MSDVRVMFATDRFTRSLLRNGWVNTTGLVVTDTDTEIQLGALTGRGQPASGSLVLPKDVSALEALAETLTQMADQLRVDDDSADDDDDDGIDWVSLASDIHHSDGECEIDGNAKVSRSDNGAYVQAWVWVDEPEIDEDDLEDAA